MQLHVPCLSPSRSVFETMDFGRVLSFYHSCGGFYVSNIIIVSSFMCMLYYMCALSMSQLDIAVLASNTVFLVGTINFLQWFVQLGLLSIIPIAVLYVLEAGIVSSLYRITMMTLTFSPIFFMFEIQTKVGGSGAIYIYV